MKNAHEFSESSKRGLYEAILKRRDIRMEFQPASIPPAVLAKLLYAAHHSGSVGFMQPWNFILIESKKTKAKIKKLFEIENSRAAGKYQGARRKKYLSMKLEGILEAPLNICVTCDRTRGGSHVLGRNTIPETDFFSTCCAIQNLWLAARAEGIGMGWVSILDNEALKKVLGIRRKNIVPIAYLCLGYVSHFPKRPMLQTKGWARRLKLERLVSFESWKGNNSAVLSELEQAWGKFAKSME